MSRFRNISTEVVVSVADEKDERFGEGWEIVKDEKPARRSASKADSKKD